MADPLLIIQNNLQKFSWSAWLASVIWDIAPDNLSLLLLET